MPYRPQIANAIKRRLRAEAGHKCGNPGCPNLRTHLHHIREWAVYQTHDEHHMIAVCPSCHDMIHNGEIPLDDATLYRWKRIQRMPGIVRTNLFIEPGPVSRVLLGSIVVAAPREAVLFELSPHNRLSFTVEDDDIFLLQLSVGTLAGDEVLHITQNQIRHERRPDVVFTQGPGAIRVVVPAGDDFIPGWALSQMRVHEPNYGANGTLTMLGIAVLAPGLVCVEGVWPQPDKVTIATSSRLSFLRPDLPQPISIQGAGEQSILQCDTIDLPLFGFDGDSVLNVGRRE